MPGCGKSIHLVLGSFYLEFEHARGLLTYSQVDARVHRS
jgi:hypothetical protein